MSSPKGERFFLDVDIDPDGVAGLVTAYDVAEQWLRSSGTSYGLPGENALLSADQAAMAQQVYDALPSQPAAVFGGSRPTARVGRLIIRTWADCPKTVQNFASLCSGVTKKRELLHYKGTRFHRLIPGFMVQGGDVGKKGDGSTGQSIWGKPFRDEPAGLKRKHDVRGLVSMANAGRKNTNTSQFFITLAPAPQCDGKHVVFGVVEQDPDNVLGAIEKVALGEHDAPGVAIVISDCGKLEE